MAPTPITSAWQAAKRSGGISSRWRRSRSGDGCPIAGGMDGFLRQSVHDGIQLGMPGQALPPAGIVTRIRFHLLRPSLQGVRTVLNIRGVLVLPLPIRNSGLVVSGRQIG